MPSIPSFGTRTLAKRDRLERFANAHSQPARWFAGTNTFVTRDATSAGQTNFDTRTAIGTVIGFVLQFSRFELTLTGCAALCSRNRFESFHRDWLAANFAEDDCLPIVGFISDLHRLREQALFFAQRTGHPRSRLNKECRYDVFVWFSRTAQRTENSQARHGVVDAAHGSPRAIRADKFVGEQLDCSVGNGRTHQPRVATARCKHA